jgi:hypothetical protein
LKSLVWRPLLILITLLVSACGSANQSAPSVVSSPSGGPASGATPIIKGHPAGALFAIDEIGVGDSGFVSLTNFTDTTGSLERLALCQGTSCAELPDVAVEPGKTVRIAVGDGSGLADVVAKEVAIGALKPLDGEVALVDSAKRDEASGILSYVEWGTDPHAMTPLAITAGLWMNGSFAPTSANATRLYRADTGLWLFDE